MVATVACRGMASLVVAGLLASPVCAAADQAAPAVLVTNGFVDTDDGAKIHYHEAGKGPALLFVPGWTMTADIWEAQIAHFSKTRRVVAIDPRGQGDSSKVTEGLHPAARARDIKTVIDTLKLAPVVVVGWSMGVPETLAYVDQFGTKDLSGVVLVDGIAGAEWDPKISPLVVAWAGGFLRDRAKQTEAFVRQMYRTPQSEDYLKKVTAWSLKTPTNTAVALFIGTMTSDLRPALAKLDKPTLIAIAPGGMWDSLYEQMRQSVEGSRLEKFEGAGHALFVDQADRFNSVLEGFLASAKAKP